MSIVIPSMDAVTFQDRTIGGGRDITDAWAFGCNRQTLAADTRLRYHPELRPFIP